MDLSCHGMESVWLEIHQSSKCKPLLIGFIYRPPSSLVSWYYIFEHQLDIASKIKSHLIVLGDFDVNILVNSESKLSMYLLWMIKDPTRVTSNTSTLIDHIYVSNTNHVGKVYVPRFSISDHYPAGLT